MSKKLFVLLFFVVAFLPFKTMAEWVSVDKNKTSNTHPEVSIFSDDNNSTVIKIDLSGFNINDFIANGKTYQSIDLFTDAFSATAGFPELPIVAKVLAIPDQAAVSYEILESGEVQFFENIYIPPARISWYEGSPEPAYDENAKAYQLDEVYPKSYVSIDPPSVFRDFRVARVAVYPIRYNAAKQQLQVVSSLTIKINYGSGEVINPKTAPKKPIAPSFGKLYRSFIFNYESVLDNFYGGKEEGHELMLCIMPDALLASFQVYADWKRQSGTDIHITSFSDIGANANNPDIIKNHISDAYFNWEVPPTYVLIVGDNGFFPIKTVTYPDYSFPNEDYFVEVEGNDFFPDMMIGRFTNQGDYRMQVMINKFILYEKFPYTANTEWFKKATCCSNNNYDSQVATKRFTADVMTVDGGFTVDTLMSDGNGWGGSGCSVHLSNVISTINEGRSWLNYRGEGWYSGWSANCYSFQVSDVTGLNNGEKFPFVTSIGCGVAGFQSSGGNCFGEEWVQLGSLTAPRGAAAFIGPTSNTHTTYNNKIDKGIYVGMYQEGLETVGESLLRGKLYMYNVFGPDYYCEYHYKIYCVLGDPSLYIWKDVPLAVSVTHPSTINVGNNALGIAVNFASGGPGVENARVCLTGNEIFVTGVTDATGNVILDVVPSIEETLTITVCGGNVIPYQGTIQVLQPQELIEPEGDPIIVDLDGNLDGLINPNENGLITFTLKNWGTLPSLNIEATLSVTNPDYISILTTTPISFGNLLSGSSYTGDPFQFFINSDCPVGEIIPLQLHVTSSTTSWDFVQNITISGCQLMYDNYIVNDAGSLNVNYHMDPGETVILSLSIQNFGDDIAPDVMGILRSDDPYITIIDSIGTYGTMSIDDVAMNTENYFKVSVASSCPTSYMAGFSVKLYTQNGNYPYESIPEFDLPVSLSVTNDYTGPDAYGYYAYSSTDLSFDQSPDYNWVEIDEIGTQIIIPDISDYTETVNLPFTFKYYGIDYDLLRISTDGWIAFGSGSQIAPVNTAIPNNDNVNNMTAVFWDDLVDLEVMEGEIYYHFDNANHRFIVQWDSIAHNGSVSEPQKEVFQAILLDPDFYPTLTGDGEIIFQYKKVLAIESNTVGIENNTQDIGLQYVFNENYDLTAAPLTNSFAIKFTTEPPFVSIVTSVDENDLDKLSGSNGFSLSQNRPNPFSSDTWINYSIPEQNNVSLKIYNINGELVRTLHNGDQPAGKYSIMWNGINDSGHPVDSGIYFYRILSGNFIETMKMFMLK